ncbi:erythroferrone-like isoform X2 [Oenanthe melanoleuca]|uniref:erythroferrone-like isoform X2 n=1 Tax=Oenanthe melanoleuca TaxID=2939378 RepID=UPI0024C1039A|nr:erythroferrone-like isoform X2 [Oenanthe melanoleuca]
MRLPELFLVLLYAAATGTEPRGAAAGRGEPGAARVEPRQAWMLLAGSPGRASGERGRGGTGAHTAPAGPGSPGKANSAAPASPRMPEELLRELQLLLRGVAKMCRTAGQGCKEESSKGKPEAGAQRRVEAAFHCQTCEDIGVEQKMWQELGSFYIPDREGMFHRGPGLNLTSGQYTAPIAGYYTFSTTLHIARREPRRKGQGWRQSRLRVLICVQSRCQHNRYGRARPGMLEAGKEPWERRNLLPPAPPSLFCSHLETVSRLESSSDLFTISVTGTLYLQAGQYASVFVDNTAGSPLTVQSGSDFSAVLLGV